MAIRLLAGAGIAAALATAGSSNARVAAAPACFGAAARDPRHPCDNPRLRLRVVPTQSDALLAPNSPCRVIETDDLVSVCESGTPAAQAVATVALVGDSHAKAWRGAADVLVRAQGWRLLTLAQTGCALSQAVRNLPEPARSACTRWNAEVTAWL